ncbi:MAG: winged helix-turn-helix transcriptional regulator [Nanoarchaeota archaeon]|jgi:DNA-binding Lrp family transcriptional regulator|nr:winged helix-turn-helix transcriptional regulator [Nanoarchaeota archaeon]
MTETLNLKDRKILLELDRNARATNAEIAKKIGLSKDSVGYRIKQLEKNKIISGYRTIINTSKLGYIQHRVALQFIDINSSILTDMISFLKKEKGVSAIAQNEGEWDFAILYLSKTSLEFYEFFERFLGGFRNVVKDKLISEIILYHEVERSYLVENIKPKKMKPKFDFEKVNIDKIDLQILNSLSENARVKLIDLADEFSLSSMLVHQRIKKLEKKGVIVSYKADINVLSLNRDYYGVKINLNNYSEKVKILDEIYSISEMTAVLYSINGYDIEFDLDILGTKEYHKVINSLRDRFSTIRGIKSIRAMEYWHVGHKLT